MPGSPSLTSITAGLQSAIVAFDAPVDGGSPILSYSAVCSSIDGGAAGGATRTTSPITVGGLTSGKTYRCSVTATNAIGTGLASPDSDPVIAQGFPGTPTITGITATYTAVSVAVAAPADTGSLPITQYRASCTSSDGGAGATTTSAASPVSVYPLTPGAHYTCTARAGNAHGFGGTSSVSPSIAVPSVASVPSAPAVNSVNPGNGQVSLVLAVNAALTGGSTLQGNTATCTSPDGGEPAAGSASNAISFTGSLMIYGITNGKTYSCAVRSYNANGAGAPAATVSFTSNLTKPIVPGAISLTGSVGSLADSGVLTGKITEVDHAGQTPTTAYWVICGSVTGGNLAILTVTRTPPETTFTITGRTKGHLYSCIYEIKQDTITVPMYSGESNIVNLGYNTSGKLPGAPPSWAVVAGNAKLTFTIASPSPAGTGAVLGYGVTCTPFSIASTGAVTFYPDVTASSFRNVVTMTNLTNGRGHNCLGWAFNSYGPGSPFVSQAVYAPFTTPNAPTGAVAAPGSGSATVRWTAPPLLNGGPATGYTVTPYVAGIAQAPRVFNSTSLTQAITGLVNGTTYAFRVSAQNSAGSGPASTASSPIMVGTPTAPGSPSASPGSGTATVTWQASTANASAITGYVVVPFIGGVAQAPRSFLNVTSATLASLVNGTTYTFKVFAKNAVGTSPASVTTAAITVGAPRAPAAPSVLSLPTLASTGSLQVSVVAPLDNGAPITSYTVTCVSNNGGVTTTVTGTTSPFVVPGNTTGKAYTCTARATNSRGTGPASVASASVTVGAPGSPTNVRAIPVPTSLSTGGLSVSFTAPANNGAVITQYTATCQSTNGGAPATKQGTSSPLLVTGNTTGKTYRCTVVANNSRGASTASLPTAPVIVGAPSAPTGVTVVRLAAGQLRVSFTAGANNGSAISSFSVTCTSSNGGTARSASGAASPITVGTLTGGKTYTCTVIATNARGPSLASSPSAAIVA